MITLYALGMDVTYIRSITGVTDIKQQSRNFISFILVIRLLVYQLIVKVVTFINIYYIKFVCELSSILSVNCLQFCR